MTRHINKKTTKLGDERSIFFTKSDPRRSNASEDFKTEFAENFEGVTSSGDASNNSNENTFAHLTEDQRIDTLKEMIKQEKKELDAITDMMAKQTAHVTNARRLLSEKQQLLQIQLSNKTSKFSTNDKLSLIGDLSVKMAHDVKNPLAVLKTQIDLMKLQFSKNENAIMLDSVNRMDRAISIITDQFDDILHFLKEEPIYEFEENSILEIIKSSLFGIKVPNNVSIVWSQNDVVISCDKNKMQRVIANMVQNAIHAINGDGAISMQIVEQSKSVLVKVTDSGPGIEDKMMNKIFDPLFTSKKHGTGLGLTICKQIIEEHGGNITVQNNPTTFTISLPKHR